MRIGVFGGTFNPPHLGHLHLINVARKKLKLDKVIVIPVNMPPHKQVHDYANPKQRLEMLRLLLAGLDFMQISEMELNREGVSFTFETISELRKTYVNDEIYLLMGSDMFLTVQSWKNPEIIFKSCIMAAINRSLDLGDELIKQMQFLEKEYTAKSVIINADVQEASSTEIREKINSGKYSDLAGVLPESIIEYIKSNGLYKHGG